MTFWRRSKRPNHELFDRQPSPPRFEGGQNYASRLRVGMAIDWLDSLPGGQGRRDLREARGYVPSIADALTTEPRPPDVHMLLDARTHTTPDSDYGPSYHADIAGHLDEEELPLAWTLYERLRGVDGTNLSALANLAELERRRGAIAAAGDLLVEAIERARASPQRRHGVRDAAWLPYLQCAHARIDGGSEEAAALLELATPESLCTLARRIGEMTRGGGPGRILAHRAFGIASEPQKVILHVAMRLKYSGPEPPPASYESFERFGEMEPLLLATDCPP